MVQDEYSKALVPSNLLPIKKYLNTYGLDKGISYCETESIIDSSNFKKKDVEELLEIIEQNYHDYDAFLILMGTDTMAYISALIAYYIEGLSKSIVFTGSQLPLFLEGSDAKNNLSYTLKGLRDQRFPKEVGVCFNEQWHRAVEVSKVHTSSFDAYGAPKKINTNKINIETLPFNIIKNISANIYCHRFIPYQNNEVLKLILKNTSLDGIILEAFGEGNFPDFDEELMFLLKKKLKEGLQVILLTQCFNGKIRLGKYAAGFIALDLGFIDGKNLTLESALAKLTYLLSVTKDRLEIRTFFEESLRGE